MPTQVYLCPIHGEFDIHLSFKDDILEFVLCTNVFKTRSGTRIHRRIKTIVCNRQSKHIISVPGGIHIKHTWNDEANEARRNPKIQRETQLKNTINESKEHGVVTDRPYV